MTPSWTLTREVEVITWQVAGMFIEPEDRTELFALLVCIVEHGGCLSAHELAAHLLGPGRAPIALQLLHLLHERGLVDEIADGWVLTALGEEVLCDRSVPTVRWGIKEVEVIEDSLLGPRLISAKPRRSENLWQAVNDSDATPLTMSDEIFASLPRIMVDGSPAGVRALGGIEAAALQHRRTGTIVIEASNAGAAVLQIDDKTRSASLRPDTLERVHSAVEKAIAAELDAEGRIPVTARDLHGLDPEALEGRPASINVGVSVDGVTGALNLHATPFPIVAADQKAADEWMRILCLRAIQGYVGTVRWEELVASAVKLVASGDLRPNVPDRHELASEPTSTGDRCWALQAPLDWGL